MRVGEVQRPRGGFFFAEPRLGGAGTPLRTSGLLDPPMFFSSGVWTPTGFPTTCFRHAGWSADAARADGSGAGYRGERAWMTAPELAIGSVGTENGPHYVEDWRRWR